MRIIFPTDNLISKNDNQKPKDYDGKQEILKWFN